MKRRLLKTIGILVLIAVMLLPPLRTAIAGGFNYYTSIFIYQNPDKMEYYVGESFDKTGMVVKGNLQRTDGTTTVYKLGLQDMTFSPSEFTKAGTIKVTISLPCMTVNGVKEPLSTSLYVTVKEYEGDPPMYWTKKITAQAEKTVYLVGEEFDQKGLKVWAHSEGDYPPDREKWDCMKYVKKISPTKFTKAGEQYVTVTAHLTTEHSSADFTAKIKVKVYKKIEITKHPGGETVKEGGSCAFTVKGKNADQYVWYFVRDNDVIPVKEKNDSRFPGLKASGIHEKKLKLSHIPAELDGWSVMCEFSNPVDSLESDTAPIHVVTKNSPSPTVEPTTEPTATPTAETKTAEATATPDVPPAISTVQPGQTVSETSAEPAHTPSSAHTHTYDGVYHSDSKQHWLECTCGERTGMAGHIVTDWVTLVTPSKNTNGIRRGHCAVCGAEITEDIPYQPPEEDEPIPWLLIIGLSLAGVAVTGCIVAGLIMLVKKGKKNASGKDDDAEA